MIDTLFFPFQFPFMVSGSLIFMNVAVAMAIFSLFLILKSWSFMKDAMSYVSCPGMLVGYIVKPLKLSLSGFPLGLLLPQLVLSNAIMAI